MDEFIVIFCTVPSKDVGGKIGGELVNKKVAACVNIVPGLTSIYEWKGNVCNDEECLLIIKTRKALFERIKKEIVALHPYELPEIIALQITDGLEPYLGWISGNTKGI
ncbi:MAG: divalent-cation tolerance protein CutA [Spirochaetes bacterium]|jgi:periplasmic divalent cation tolerance protein|nr:divalent-cation tolerance protein CutA [Spirochaetota bacterium]